jgi:hypothetical protein
MGDRTYVTLLLRREDLTRNQDIDDLDVSDNPQADRNGLVSLSFEEVNYAELGIEDELQRRMIPYDKEWDAGDEYPRGRECCRILRDGSLDVKEFIEGGEHTVDLSKVVNAYQSGTIHSFLEEALASKSVLSWEDQEKIMVARAKTRDDLLALSSDELFSIVTRVLDSAGTQGESVTSDADKAVQVEFLLSAGYYGEDSKPPQINKRSLNQPSQPPLRFAIHIDGGIVQGVFCEDTKAHNCSFSSYDYDVGDLCDDEITLIGQPNGEKAEAFVTHLGASVKPGINLSDVFEDE